MYPSASDYPVATPYRGPAVARLQPAEPVARPARSFGLFLRLIGVVVVGVAGVLVGGFALPDNRGPAAVMPPQLPDEQPQEMLNVADEVVIEKEAPATTTLPAAAPAPASPRFVRLPHPLDAAPKVVPQLPAGPAFDLARAIDREIDAALAAAKLPPSPPAEDAEFLRRVTLDLTGTIPTYDRTVAFLLDSDPYKRAKLIDELLASSAYGRHFAHIWADLLIKRDFDSNKNLKTEPFVNWLAEQFNEGKGWDAIVRDLLTASGKEAETPQTLFYQANQDNNQPSPAKLVGATANLFLGIQLQCAECHVHPTVDQWTQKDFWGLAAFFGHVRFERDGGVKAVKQGGPVTLHEVERKAEPKGKAAKKNGDKAIAPGAIIPIPDPTDNKKTVGTAKAKVFEGTMPSLRSVPYRPKLAEWLTSTQDRYFAPAAVNRLWAHLFARGLVHPVEEMHPGNAPSHPAVLKQLSAAFVKSGYDLKFVLRALCNTRAYQRTSRPLPENAEDEKLLSHMPVKVIGARELLDALATATGYRERETPNRQAGRPMNGVKAPARPVTMVRFFDTRDYDDDPTEYAYGVPQVLKLMNSNLTQRAAEAAARVVRAGQGDRSRVIEDLYLTTLARRPRAEELERLAGYVAAQGDRQKGFAGVMWVLLNSAEFVSNH